MKKIIILLTICIVFVSCGADDKNKQVTKQAQQEKYITEKDSKKPKIARRAEFKSGIIEYTTTGFSTGKQTLFFDDWGFKNAILQEIKIGETTVQNHIIITEDWTYQINNTEKRYIKLQSDDSKKYREFYEQTKNNAEASKKLLEWAGGKMIGKEKFMEKDCEVWFMPTQNAKNWLWNGLILKSVMSMPFGDLTFEATKIKTDIKIPDSVFAIPKNVEFKLAQPKKKEGL